MEKLKTAISRQIEWQKTMNSNHNTMYLAWVEELGELVASMGYADWKKVARDEQNIIVEAVDLIIFTINMSYYSGLEVNLDASIRKVSTDVEFVSYLNYYMAVGLLSEVILLIVDRIPAALQMLIHKQALNDLRQKYGYKEGNYIKAWPKGEDNVYLETLDPEADFDEAYEALETIYTTTVIPARLFVD
jgi:hypothetical protein